MFSFFSLFGFRAAAKQGHNQIQCYLSHCNLQKKKKKLATSQWLAGDSQVALVVKNLPANAEDLREAGLIPGSRRSPGGGHGNSLQYSCSENPMDRGALWAIVYRIPQGRTRLSKLSMHAHSVDYIPCR